MSDLRQEVMDLVLGRWRSQILYTAVKLGVFEALDRQGRPAAELARELGLSPDHSYRLLRALDCIGLLLEDDNARFSLTEQGRFLRAEHPQTLRGVALLEEGPEHYAVWKHLPAIVADGKENGFVREYGHPIFEHVAKDPGYAAVFNDAMTSFSAGETAMVLQALEGCDLSGISHLCDIAGGRGHLLCSLLAKHPHIRGTIYELPTTFSDPGLLWANKMDLADRCEHVTGDMFESVPAADAYLMKHILHDWNDDECRQILSNCREASAPGARLFIAEVVVPGPDEPHFAKLFDIHMMCATGGAERTEPEYAALFEASGWKHVKRWRAGPAPMSVVEAARA